MNCHTFENSSFDFDDQFQNLLFLPQHYTVYYRKWDGHGKSVKWFCSFKKCIAFET